MSTLDSARETQLRNIEARTGKTIVELRDIINQSGLTKHGEIRSMLMEKLGLGYGDANSLVHYALESDGQSRAVALGLNTTELLDELYSGSKAGLRPLHEKVMETINGFGAFEIAPKKGYLSLRRKRQFAMVGPGTRGRLEIGLNLKDVEGNDRFIAQAPGGMCRFKVFLTGIDEVDNELFNWIRQSYDQAG